MQINDKLIADFVEYAKARGLSQRRVLKYDYEMRNIAKWLGKPFKRATRKDIIKVVNCIEDNGYAPETKHDYLSMIKIFWRWLRQMDDYPEEVRWVRTTIKEKRFIPPEQILTEEEVYKMVDGATHPRNKAFIALSYESLARPGEMLDLKISDIQRDDKGIYFLANSTKTKSQTPKRIMNDRTIQLLDIWLENHPFKNDKEAPLWITLGTNSRYKKLNWGGANKMFKDVAVNLGWGTWEITTKGRVRKFKFIPKTDKIINLNFLRHAKITDLRYNKGVPESIIKMMAGHSPSSKTLEVYSHGKFADIDNALEKIYGKGKEKDAKKLEQDVIKVLETNEELRKSLAKAIAQIRLKGG